MTLLLICLFLVEMLVLSALVHTEHQFWGLFSLAIAMTCYSLVEGTNPVTGLWALITDKPAQVILVSVGYLIIGVVWSFFKYYTYVKKRQREGASKTTLLSEDNSGRVMGWIAFWPASMVGHVLGDGIYRMFQWIYEQFKDVYPKIVNAVYGK